MMFGNQEKDFSVNIPSIDNEQMKTDSQTSNVDDIYWGHKTILSW